MGHHCVSPIAATEMNGNREFDLIVRIKYGGELSSTETKNEKNKIKSITCRCMGNVDQKKYFIDSNQIALTR